MTVIIYYHLPDVIPKRYDAGWHNVILLILFVMLNKTGLVYRIWKLFFFVPGSIGHGRETVDYKIGMVYSVYIISTLMVLW